MKVTRKVGGQTVEVSGAPTPADAEYLLDRVADAWTENEAEGHGMSLSDVVTEANMQAVDDGYRNVSIRVWLNPR